MEIPLLLLIIAHHLQAILSQQYFRVKPHDTSVIAGRTAELHCQVGNRAGSVQWSKDGFLLGFDPAIPGYARYEMRVDHGKSAYTLLVHEARLEDEAEFQCQVGPGKSEKPIRAVARLTVLVPPKLLSINNLPDGDEIEVPEAEKVILTCEALASKPATIIKWYRKSVELMQEASRTTVRREGEKLYTTLSSITLYPKGDNSGATYTCEALHPALEKPLRTAVSVGVLYPPGPPEIEGYRIGDVAEVGDHLTLACISRGGKPPARLVWTRNNKEVKGTYSTSGRDATNTLTFTVISADNNAEYSCAAANPLTPIPLLETVKLTVLFPPTSVMLDGPAEAYRGDTVTVNCRTDASNPPAQITWLLDGVPVEPLETATYAADGGWVTSSNLTVIISRQDKDTKAFTCYAIGVPRRQPVSQTFNVTIIYPPETPVITGYDEGTSLREGQLQRFTCLAIGGHPPADLRWYRGETEMKTPVSIASGHLSSVLTLQIEPADNGIIVRCEVNNSAVPEPLAAEVKLTVLFPPPNVTITVDPPQPREGDKVKLECWSGSSNPAAKILWWRDDSLLPEHQVQIMDATHGGSATRSRLSLPLTSADDGTRFTCEAKNDAFQRSTRDQVTLRVLYAPDFVSSKKVLELIEGRSGEFNVTARAYPEVHQYAWSKGGIDIPSKPDDFRQIPRVSADGAVLYFSRVSRYDAGIYTCVAQNSEGSATATVTLNVLYPASVFNINGSTEVAEGDTANLECSASGNPLTDKTIQWRRRDNQRLLPSLVPEAGRSLLTLSNVSRLDAGMLECIANNGIGSASVSVTQLVVMYRPAILREDLKRRIAVGERDSAELNCGAEGYPDITFTWSYNGSAIGAGPTETAKYIVRQSRRKEHEWWSSLVVRAIDWGDLGMYMCVAGNQLGHDFITFTVARRGVPDQPEHLIANNITHQSVLLSWKAGFDGGLHQSFRIRYRASHAPSYLFLDVPSNRSSFLVTGLQQGKVYEFSVSARNMLGDSAFTSVLRIITKSLPVMDSTVAVPDTQGGSSDSLLPVWLIAAAVVGSLIVLANVLLCVVYIRRKRWCHRPVAVSGSPTTDVDDISREKIVKKIPCASDEPPFYLTGTTVDIPDDGLDLSSFQKAPSLRQVSRESSDDGHSSGRRCDCGGRQWSSTLICGGRSPGNERTGNQHEQCPDILKRDSCHCHSSVPAGKRPVQVEEDVSSSLGAVMYGQNDLEAESDFQADPLSPSPPQITLTTFQSKSELPIRHSLLEIITPKMETAIDEDPDDS